MRLLGHSLNILDKPLVLGIISFLIGMSTIINNMIAIKQFCKYMMYIVITIKLLSISWCMDVLTYEYLHV